MWHYLAGQAVGIVLGVVAGAFMPAVLRKIKGLFVKETQYVEGQVKSGLGGIGKRL